MHSQRNAFLMWAGWMLVVVFLRVGPASLLQNARISLQAMLGGILNCLPEPFISGSTTTTGNVEDAKFAQIQSENRELKRLLAEFHARQIASQQEQQRSPDAEQRLLQVQATSARVIGRKGDLLSSNLQLLISLGKAAGLNDADLVLSGDGLLIDAGQDFQLQPDQYLTAGRALLGRTTRVGRHTALVQPLTDSSFRMAVRIVRPSPLGPVQGPPGVLAGTGSGCRIDEVSALEAVGVGDDVYSDPSASPTGVPVYCGRITEAEISPTAAHWSIKLEPANSPDHFPLHVQILKSNLNPKRVTPTPRQ